MGLNPGSILNGFGHPFRERGHIPVADLVFKHLGAVLGYYPGYIDIEHLPSLVAYLMIPTGRQTAAVDIDRFDSIRIINLFQGYAGMAILIAFFSAGFGLRFFSCLDQPMAVCCCLCYPSSNDWQAG
jgi:hypothetical protein